MGNSPDKFWIRHASPTEKNSFPPGYVDQLLSLMKKKSGQRSSLEKSLLEASPKEYMSPSQLAFFRVRLEDERQKLLERARGALEPIQDAVLQPDSNDRASLEEGLSFEFRTRDRERKLLRKIDEALIAIDKKNYGWCQETGEPIGIPRLLARPTLTLCIEAQERHELDGRIQSI